VISRIVGLSADAGADLLRARRPLLLTGLAYRLVAFVLLTPVVAGLLRLFMWLGGNEVLADQAIALFLLSPLGAGTVLVVGAAAIAVVALEQACLMAVCLGAIDDANVAARPALAFALRHALDIGRVAMRVLARVVLLSLPFVAAVMDHPKFISGDITTAFIAEEYPEGFEGVTLGAAELRRVAAAAAAMHRVAEIRRTRVSGRLGNHERVVGTDWVVTAQGERFDVTIAADPDGATVSFADGDAMRVTSDWTPGGQLARLDVDGAPLVLKVGKIPGGFRLRTRGAELKVTIRAPRHAPSCRRNCVCRLKKTGGRRDFIARSGWSPDATLSAAT